MLSLYRLQFTYERGEIGREDEKWYVRTCGSSSYCQAEFLAPIGRSPDHEER